MKSPSASSEQWGSYFVDAAHRSGGGEEAGQKLTWCCHCIHKYSTMAIPSVEHIAGTDAPPPLLLRIQESHSGLRGDITTCDPGGGAVIKRVSARAHAQNQFCPSKLQPSTPRNLVM